MANKYQLITGVFNEEISQITQDQEKWTAYLKTAANNYKYKFIDQVLIHAQRPDATACAEINIWNKVGRLVNKGSRGIALFDHSASYPRLRYVFDVSDTNSLYGTELSVWKAEQRYNDEISEALSNAFGKTEGSSLASVIYNISQNMAENNATNYISAIENLKIGSFIEKFDEQTITTLFKVALSSSVGYMIMTRCGINADNFYKKSDFNDIVNFNTSPLIITFGTAVSETAETVLREIESTVKKLQNDERKANRTFVISGEKEYNETVKNILDAERSKGNGRDNIQTGWRLPNSEHSSSERGNKPFKQIRFDEKEFSAEQQTSSLGNFNFSGQADTAPSGNTAASSRDGGNDNQPNDEGAGRNGGAESNRPNEVGSVDEQHSELSSGDNSSRPDLRISGHDFNGHSNGIDYFYQNKEKNELIRTYLEAHKDEIAEFFEVHSDREERGDFLMSFFTSEPFETTLSNGVKAGFTAYEDAVYFWRENKNAPTHECWERWVQIANSVYGMILIEEWTEPQALLLPNLIEQIEFIDRKRKEKYVQLSFPQTAFDYVITRGSGFSEGKMRIYEHFSKSHSHDDNIKFLKDEYGTGGHSDAVPGTGYWENHNAEGVEIEDWYSEPKRKILLSWSQVEKRISELIAVDRYLNPKEKEIYPQWLEKQEERRLELALETERRKILQTAPPEPKEYEYHFSLGDTVYIGADEYTIMSLAEPVALSNSKYPLFTEQLTKTDFEQKVKENPANNHLRVEIAKQPTEEKHKNNPTWDEYSKIKSENPDSIVFYQVGDFYEAMGDDAKVAAGELDLVLTGRDVGFSERIALCGLPTKSLNDYLNKLTNKGYKVTVSSLKNNGERIEITYSSATNKDTILKPYITCEWSESSVFEDGKVYSVAEFDSLMKQADENRVSGQKSQIEKYGSQTAWYEAMSNTRESDENYSNVFDFAGYDKVKFTLTMPDGKTYTERQDIGDGNGGVIDFLKMYPAYDDIVPILEELVKSENPDYSSPTKDTVEKNNFNLADFQIETVGKKERFHRNMEAIRVLKECEFDNRYATPEEQKILSRYVGWGGLSEAFDENNTAWADEYKELIVALSPDEYAAAKESTLTAFYTPPVVIRSIYQALENIGFKTGNILEPSCGVGNFIGMLPDSMQDSKFYGVELDSISGRIAQQLYAWL